MVPGLRMVVAGSLLGEIVRSPHPSGKSSFSEAPRLCALLQGH